MFDTIPVEMWARERKNIAEIVMKALLEGSEESQGAMSRLLDIEMSYSPPSKEQEEISPRVEIEKLALKAAIENADALVRILAQHLKNNSTTVQQTKLQGRCDRSVRLLLSLMRHSDWFFEARDTMREIEFWDIAVKMFTRKSGPASLSPNGCVNLVRCFCALLRIETGGQNDLSDHLLRSETFLSSSLNLIRPAHVSAILSWGGKGGGASGVLTLLDTVSSLVRIPFVRNMKNVIRSVQQTLYRAQFISNALSTIETLSSSTSSSSDDDNNQDDASYVETMYVLSKLVLFSDHFAKQFVNSNGPKRILRFLKCSHRVSLLVDSLLVLSQLARSSSK
jgi:hypothetical protein